MKLIMKYLKKSSLSIAIIVLLLLIQSFSDLALPGFTSKIVNVGIQQSGIVNSSPEILKTEKYDRLTVLMDEGNKNLADSIYKPLSESALGEKLFNEYMSEYPELSGQDVLIRTGASNEDLQKLNANFASAIYLAGSLGGNGKANIPALDDYIGSLPENERDLLVNDWYSYLSGLDAADRNRFVTEANASLLSVSESILQQEAILYIKNELIQIGIDTNAMQIGYLISEGLNMLFISLISVIAAVTTSYFTSRTSATLGHDLRKDVFDKVVSFSSAEMDRFSTASLITRSTNDIQNIQLMSAVGLRLLVSAPLMAIGGIINAISTNVSMSWVILVAIGGTLSVVLTLFSIATPRFKIVQKYIDKMNLVMREILTGIPVIRAFNTARYEEQRFDDVNRDLRKLRIFLNRTMGIMMPSMIFIMNAITILIVYKGAQSVDSGLMQVGDIMAFIQYTMHIIMSFQMFSMISIQLSRSLVSADRISEILQVEPEITDPKRPQHFNAEMRGTVEFKNVYFKYPDAEENILTDISFVAKPYETTAIIGGTGSGKTTLINLIPRFFEVTGGEILVDGVNIKDVNQGELRSKIGYIPQKGILFSGTIESNIKFAGEKIDDQSMIKAAKVAQAAEFIDQKELGYQDPIAQAGTNISGGQKQRLSIARAIAADPDIYIFDDSFSALDFKTDWALRRDLKTQIRHATVIIVAQRINTIMNANKILVLDEGRVAGEGTHSELMETCEIYRQIAQSQLSEEELINE